MALNDSDLQQGRVPGLEERKLRDFALYFLSFSSFQTVTSIFFFINISLTVALNASNPQQGRVPSIEKENHELSHYTFSVFPVSKL